MVVMVVLNSSQTCQKCSEKIVKNTNPKLSNNLSNLKFQIPKKNLKRIIRFFSKYFLSTLVQILKKLFTKINGVIVQY